MPAIGPIVSRTDRRTDGRTDDMRSQDRALHYSASHSKNAIQTITMGEKPQIGLPFLYWMWTPYNRLGLYTHTLTDPTYYPKRHPDLISRFATVHPPGRLTDQQMGWATGL